MEPVSTSVAVSAAATKAAKTFLDFCLSMYRERKQLELAKEALAVKKYQIQTEFEFAKKKLISEHKQRMLIIKKAFESQKDGMQKFFESTRDREIFMSQQLSMCLHAITNPATPTDEKAFLKKQYESWASEWKNAIKHNNNILLEYANSGMRQLQTSFTALENSSGKLIK